MLVRVALGTIGLVAVGVGLTLADPQRATAQQAATPPAPTVNRDLLHAQVILSKLGFSSGLLDAKTVAALSQYRGWRPTKTIKLSAGMLAGPFINPTPKDYADQAKLPGLYYRSPLEKLAEMFHTSPEMLVALNSRETPLKAGQEIVVPNALPASRDYSIDDATWKKTVAYLNVDATQPEADHVIVDESEGVLKVFDKADKLVAQFPATMGSAEFPLPIGEWTIKGNAYNPDWKYDPKLIAGSKPGAKEQVVPPGPNNPVGVVWMDLSKPHYGIHGTPEPQNIGKTESNGCIRLTNWDAARLSLMVKPGTKALFRK